MWVSDVISLATVGASLIAVLLSFRALRLGNNANQIPVVVGLISIYCDPKFVRKEEYLWEHMKDSETRLGFTGLPDPIKDYAIEVGQYYQSLALLVEFGIADRELVTLQSQYRAIRTWDAIAAHVRGERNLRGGEYTFFNTFEVFVAKLGELDAADINERMRKSGPRFALKRFDRRKNGM